jgi:hypothetical protein
VSRSGLSGGVLSGMRNSIGAAGCININFGLSGCYAPGPRGGRLSRCQPLQFPCGCRRLRLPTNSRRDRRAKPLPLGHHATRRAAAADGGPVMPRQRRAWLNECATSCRVIGPSVAATRRRSSRSEAWLGDRVAPRDGSALPAGDPAGGGTRVAGAPPPPGIQRWATGGGRNGHPRKNSHAPWGFAVRSRPVLGRSPLGVWPSCRRLGRWPTLEVRLRNV